MSLKYSPFVPQKFETMAFLSTEKDNSNQAVPARKNNQPEIKEAFAGSVSGTVYSLNTGELFNP